jgi:hypothetical protein
LVFLDETGFLLQPLRRRTWAPRGQTPVLYAWDRHDRWSVLGAISLAPWALRLGLYFRLLDRNIQASDVVDFLRQLHRHLQRKIILVLDRWGVHRRAVRELQEQGVSWLQVEWLPAYAPDLNPVEHVWNHTKWAELANFVPRDAYHLHEAVHQSLEGQRHDPQGLYACFRAAGLSL